MKKIKTKLFKIVLVVLLFFLSTSFVHAATIGFSSFRESYNVGDTVNVKVYVGTNGISVNAIAAKIKFSSDILTLISTSKIGSVINLWAQEPSYSNSDGVVFFEGVTLNGYSGNSGTALTLVFKAKKQGIANLSFNSASILANDGNGTEVLNNKNSVSILIKKSDEVVKTTKSDLTPEVPVKDMTIVISEIKNNSPKYSPNKFLITTVEPVADKSFQIQIDSLTPIIWIDDGSHLYQAPKLDNGIHIIKVMAVDTSSNQLSGFLNFSTIVLKVPEITYYPKNLYVGDFLVLKGIADPLINVELTIKNKENNKVIIDNIVSNSDGDFTYVPDKELSPGIYSIIGRSVSINGISSDYMDPIEVVKREHGFNYFITMFSNYLLILIPFISLLVLFIVIFIYGYYRIKKLHITLKKKILDTENIVSSSFIGLNDDINKEIDILKKVKEKRPINEEEQDILNKIKNDIKIAEKNIENELKDVEKANNKQF